VAQSSLPAYTPPRFNNPKTQIASMMPGMIRMYFCEVSDLAIRKLPKAARDIKENERTVRRIAGSH
jgi:hypothetical protein